VATWDDVRRIALSLPDTGERFVHGSQGWHVHNKGFVEHLVAKEALISDAPDIYFTTPHFDGYAAVLVRLEQIPLDELQELIVEAWLARAPRRLARDYVAAHLPDAE
jgi:hypothetical protein